MENSNKTAYSSSGNNENESESLRNSQQKNKNFMSPTISASSKFNSSPNKKVFGEWKSPKSDLSKLGNSNSGSRKSLPKIPLISPKNAAVHDVDDTGSVIDSVDVPYDPLTNYLSPRPKFLRYRPNRRREILVKRDEKIDTESDTDSNSLRDSIDSQGFSCIDSLSNKDCEEIVISDKQVVVLDEEDEDLDEFEEENWGLKWGLLKFLIVFCSLFFCTIFISSMNSSSFVVKQEFKGVGIEYKQIVDMGFKIVSLRSLGSGKLMLGGKNSSDSGLFELDYSGVEFDENLSGSVEDDDTEILTKVKSLEDYYQNRPRLEDEFQVTNAALESDQKNLNAEVNGTKVPKKMKFLGDYYQSRPRLEDKFGVTNGVLELVEGPRSEDFSGVVLGSVVDNAAEVPDNKATEEEVGIDFQKGTEDSDRKAEDFSEGHVDFAVVPNVGDEEHEIADARTEYYQAEIEAQIVASEQSEVPDVEVSNVGEEKSGFADARNEYYQAENEVQVVASEQSEAPDVEDLVGMPSFEAKIDDSEVKSNQTVEEEIRAHFDKGMENAEAESKEGRKANEDYRLTFSELIWLVISPLVAFGLLGSVVWKFYCKCRRASSKTRSSNLKLCSNIGTAAKSRQGLPPKSAEKTERYRQLNAPSVGKFDHSEVSTPTSANPVEILERDDHTIIPKLTQLGEFEVGVEFTQSAKAIPDIKGATRRGSLSGRATNFQPSSFGLSAAESYSRGGGTYIPQDVTSMMKDGRQEVGTKAAPTPRRSTRLQSKGVTSP